MTLKFFKLLQRNIEDDLNIIIPSNTDFLDGVLIIRAEPEQKGYLQRLRKIFFQLGAFAHPIRFFRIEWISLTHFSIILFSLITSWFCRVLTRDFEATRIVIITILDTLF